MRTADVIKSKYIRGKDLEGKPPLTLTISDVSEELVGRGLRQDTKCILWFHEDHRGISINKARLGILEAAYGPETDLWSGKRVRLFYDANVEFGGKRVGGVGLRTPPGVVYSGSGAQPGWVEPEKAPGRPPAPTWDDKRQEWILPPPPEAARAPARPRPPAPVWNEVTQAWETVDTSTGEIAPPKHVPPPTISERVNAGNPAKSDGGWGEVAPPTRTRDPNAEFDDDIPF